MQHSAIDRQNTFGQTSTVVTQIRTRFSTLMLAAAAMLAVAASSVTVATAQTPGTFQVTNILSDGYVPALATDPSFVDPWGVSIGKDFWINTNVTGLDYVSLSTGSTAFKVTIPPTGGGTGTGSPTGTVFNSTPGFVLSNGSAAAFLFSSLDGTISGWNGGLFATGNHALIAVDNGAKNAVYTDMALITDSAGTYILAANFGQGADVEVYDATFKPATLTGSFTDPNVPTGYAPYSVHSLGGQVYVTYMLRSTPTYAGATGSYQETLGTNTGFVDVFDVNGNFVSRAITGGNLNAPWGVAIAPAGFGIYGGDLLVGNFGDGLINVYDPKTFAYLGQLADATGKALAYPGLWELVFGTSNGTTGYGDPNTVFFTAGLAHETHGLFGSIANSAPTAATPVFALSASTQVASVAAGSSSVMTISVAPTNAFTGSVNLSCTGLPTGATCSFASGSLSILPNAPVTTTLTIQTAGPSTTASNSSHTGEALSIVTAMLLPFGSLLAFRRRRYSAKLRSLGVAAFLFAIMLGATGLMTGCSNYTAPATPAVPVTPAGTSNVTITAVSGTTTQTAVIALTVK